MGLRVFAKALYAQIVFGDIARQMGHWPGPHGFATLYYHRVIRDSAQLFERFIDK